jgi:Protein of unknown function (DUF1353)
VDDPARRLEQDPVDIPGSRLPPPVLTHLGGRRWRLEADYTYHDGPTAITVPAGFRFDLSSVPRALWSVIAPFELSIVAPLLHDFLYQCGGRPPDVSIDPPRSYTRAEVDRMFLEIMAAEDVARWRRRLAYSAVRTFGRGAWRG